VQDEGVPQQVSLATFDEVPLNVILALDLSHSVSGERLAHLRSAGRAVLDDLTPGDSGALVTFSHVVTVRQAPTQDVGLLCDALIGLEPGGRTALVDAAYAAMMLAESDPGRDLVIIFSDGRDTSSWLTPNRVLESARRLDVTVYSVSVRGSGNTRFLEDLRKLTGGRTIEISSTSNLTQTFVDILDEFRHRYLISYSPHGVSKDGWHSLRVRVKRREVKVNARAGYHAGS
jgi:VWFA-related protein